MYVYVWPNLKTQTTVLLAGKINSNLTHSLLAVYKELSVSARWQRILQSASWPGFRLSVATR